MKLKAQSSKFNTSIQNLKFYILSFSFALCTLHFALSCYAQESKPEPVIVNGDKVEYSTDSREVTVTGNAEVISKGAKLTCDNLTLNTQTKDAEAFGNARLDDQKGVIEGKKIIYNFQNKTGIIIDSEFRSNPYFGKAEKVDKVSEAEFIARRGYMSTCSYDNPHYRIKSRKINFFPGDKVQTKDDTIYVGKIPMLYLPQYNHSLKDPLVHVQLMPGKRKDWGPYMLTAWRYNISDDIKGRIYFDYREKLGNAEGFGLNYTTRQFGKGDYKYYYTQERSRLFLQNQPAEFQRYLIRWRHKWDIDVRTNIISEFYRIGDEKRKFLDTQVNLLKDYFYREYEKDSQPLSYALFHHSFARSSIDLLVQKRTNHWYDQLDKLPEVKYTLPSWQIGESPFYFENNSSLVNFNKKATTLLASTDDVTMTRFDITNKVSLPMKVSFFRIAPFVSSRQTLYDKGADDDTGPPIRTIFYSGADLSTKFYRLFNVKSHFLGMDINGLRHIITPTISYSYNHEPTILSSKLRQIDSVDSIGPSNSATLELSNKFQTKRKGKRVDIANLKVNTSYTFKPKTVGKRGSSLSDFLFDLELRPYSWMSIDTDATYKHSGIRDSRDYRRFTNANFNVNFNLASERSIGFGHRYQRKAGKEFTFNTDWRLTPKWKFGIYERYQIANIPGYKRGIREQQYLLSRDLHCWITEITYNVTRDQGESIWLIFRLKAFPELEFNFNQSYRQPKPGSQATQQ